MGRKKNRDKLRITYEIIPQGTLTRNPSGTTLSPEEHWEEICSICSEIIAESQKPSFDK